MATDADICNLALSMIGERQFISALDEGTTRSKLCSLYYANERDKLLQRFPWSFATFTAALEAAASPADAAVIPGWGFTYDLPDDFLRAQYIFNGLRPGQAIGSVPAASNAPVPLPWPGAGAAPSLPFKALNGYLFTDVDDAQLVYTAQVTDASTFPALWVEALALAVAVKLALSDAKLAQLAVGLQSRFTQALAEAAAADANEGQPDPEPESSFITARY